MNEGRPRRFCEAEPASKNENKTPGRIFTHRILGLTHLIFPECGAGTAQRISRFPGACRGAVSASSQHEGVGYYLGSGHARKEGSKGTGVLVSSPGAFHGIDCTHSQIRLPNGPRGMFQRSGRWWLHRVSPGVISPFWNLRFPIRQ
jgi:hypothetical protein